MITLEVFIGNDYLGKAEASLTRVHETYANPLSVVYVCPNCGDAWGRLLYRVNGVMTKWTTYSVSCVKCPPHLVETPSGVLINGGSRIELLSHLPRQAVERDFNLWYNYLMKGVKDATPVA